MITCRKGQSLPCARRRPKYRCGLHDVESPASFHPGGKRQPAVSGRPSSSWAPQPVSGSRHPRSRLLRHQVSFLELAAANSLAVRRNIFTGQTSRNSDPGKGADFSPSCHVPEFDAFVGAQCQLLAVGSKSDVPLLPSPVSGYAVSAWQTPRPTISGCCANLEDAI